MKKTAIPAPPAMHLALGSFVSQVQQAGDAWEHDRNTQRLWARDPGLWSGTDEAAWLGWLDIVNDCLAHREVYAKIAKAARSGGYRHILLLGMGGSSLAPEVWKKTFGSLAGFPELLVLDATDPAQVRAFERRIDVANTLFIVSSKSGSTIEPNVFKQYFFERVCERLGAEEAGKRFIAITDEATPRSKLHEVARRDHFGAIHFGWTSIGGRFSALSNFGLVPMAAMGVDAVRFLDRTSIMVRACGADVPIEHNPGVQLGIMLGTLARLGRDKVTVIASPGIAGLGAWMEQLIAESTGKAHPVTKQGVGLVPVDGERVGSPGVYGSDRVFIYERLASGASREQDDAMDALERAGHPVVRIELTDEYDLGQEMFRWEIATAVAGSLLGINPFNQPDVEAAKIVARTLMDDVVKQGSLPAEQPVFSEDALAALFNSLKPGDYFAINAYVEMNAENEAILQGLRHTVRDTKRVATTLGFGPRFLHSTGQLHKGGPNTGVFLQVTCDDAEDVKIPGEQFSFGVLKAAQAAGDMAVLAERGRRVCRVHVSGNVAAGLKRLAEYVRGALVRP